jgi:hypothetical protein
MGSGPWRWAGVVKAPREATERLVPHRGSVTGCWGVEIGPQGDLVPPSMWPAPWKGLRTLSMGWATS